MLCAAGSRALGAGGCGCRRHLRPPRGGCTPRRALGTRACVWWAIRCGAATPQPRPVSRLPEPPHLLAGHGLDNVLAIGARVGQRERAGLRVEAVQVARRGVQHRVELAHKLVGDLRGRAGRAGGRRLWAAGGASRPAAHQGAAIACRLRAARPVPGAAPAHRLRRRGVLHERGLLRIGGHQEVAPGQQAGEPAAGNLRPLITACRHAVAMIRSWGAPQPAPRKC